MDKPYGGPERRKSKRLKVTFLIIYEIRKPLEVIMMIGTRQISAIMLDLSEGGMAISTSYNIPVATILLLKFTLVNPYASTDKRVRTMEITGEIRNNSCLQKNEYRLGIAFTQIAKEDKDAIVNFVKLSR